SPGGDDGTDAPTLTIAEADDGFVSADELSDGIQAVVTLTSGTQAGDTVTITVTGGADGEQTFTQAVTADDLSAGEVDVTLNGDITDGDYSAVASITDGAGNDSAASDAVDFTVDATAPDAPTLNVVANDDGTVTASGEAEPGSTVTVTFPDGTTGELVAGDDGSFEATSDGAQPSGEVSATATDAAGNESGVTTQDYDVVTPDTPILAIPANADGFINAEEENSGLEANVILDEPAQAGEDVVVTVTDDEGTSAEATLTLTADDIEAGSVSLPLDFADLTEGALEASATVGGRDANSLD
uniref:Ig-like domain-containing protein n=1 Tax=Halomonas elongata TaxID=2746 RepID=UPI0023B122E9